MGNPPYPPLLAYMTLEEAAEAVSIRLGQHWSARRLLDCAGRGEFLIHARLPAACRLVRAVRYKEGCDEVLAEAGSLPTISLAACRGLLLAGITDFDGQAAFTDLPDWFTGGEPLLGDNGKPMRDVVVTWRLADGETPPEIRLEDCRISASSLEELMTAYAPIPCIESTHAEPATPPCAGETPQFATLQEVLANDWPLCGGYQQSSFENALSDVPQWLAEAIKMRGSPGKSSNLWNPAMIAFCLMTNRKASKGALTVHIRAHFPEWLNEWETIKDE